LLLFVVVVVFVFVVVVVIIAVGVFFVIRSHVQSRLKSLMTQSEIAEAYNSLRV
jgi:hypothetical protein